MEENKLLTLVKYFGGLEHFIEKDWASLKLDQELKNSLTVVRGIEYFKKPGLFLHGSPGTGKSHIAKAMFMDIVRWKQSIYDSGLEASGVPYWIGMSHYLEAMRGEPDDKLKKRAMTATTLFIDDLGTSTKTDWAIDQIWQLIDYRWSQDLQTIITSNHTLQELSAMYHDRLTSRISAMCIPLEIRGNDFRKNESRENFKTVIKNINQNQGED